VYKKNQLIPYQILLGIFPCLPWSPSTIIPRAINQLAANEIKPNQAESRWIKPNQPKNRVQSMCTHGSGSAPLCGGSARVVQSMCSQCAVMCSKNGVMLARTRQSGRLSQKSYFDDSVRP
jgi:hypothetical protein